MSKDYQLEKIPTTGGKESKGMAMGLEGNLFIPFSITCLISAFAGLYTVKYSIILGFLILVGLPGLMYAFLLFFLNSKPPHYIEDFFHSLISEGKSRSFPKSSNNPFNNKVD